MKNKSCVALLNCLVKITLDKDFIITESIYISPMPYEDIQDIISEVIMKIIKRKYVKNKTINIDILTTNIVGESSHKFLWKPGKTRFLISRTY